MRELDLSGVLERTDRPRVLAENGESYHSASKEIILGTEQSLVGDSLESPSDGSSTANDTTANGRVLDEGREHLDVRQAKFGEDVVVERMGGTTGSPRTHGMFRAEREIGPAPVAGIELNVPSIRLEEAKANQEKQRTQDQANQSSLNGNPPNSNGEIVLSLKRRYNCRRISSASNNQHHMASTHFAESGQ